MVIEGNLVNNIEGITRGRVEIADNGVITAVDKPMGVADIVLKDELIFPGFIDLHVHARECADHSWDYKEDFSTAGAAAINGGVVAFADMPNNPVPPVDEQSYADKYQLAKKSVVDVLLYAGIGPVAKPLFPSYDFNGRSNHKTKQKAVPYKVFMGQSVGGLFFSTHDELAAALENYRGESVSFHCEDPEILEAAKTSATHELRRPPSAESSAVDFALETIKKFGLKGKICHCSTMEGLQKIIQAKKSGLPVTVEVTPHHLFFDYSEIARSASDEAISSKEETALPLSASGLAVSEMLQVNPPIRQSKENRLALIEALKNGDIDYLATDHAPHTMAEKEQGMSGIPHLDTYGPFAAWLMAEHGFSPENIARVCSFNPGRFFNEFSEVKYGQIAPGFAGSLTIMDMNRPIRIEKSMLKTKCGWSPFEGVTFPGSVAMTVVGGKVFKKSL